MKARRIHAFYSGRVQGVGFRYAVQSIADELGLVGWVKNLRDGRVEVVCEGQEAKLKTFLGRVNDEFSGRYIIDTDINWEDPAQEFTGFDIRF